jgi:hypothetical protein
LKKTLVSLLIIVLACSITLPFIPTAISQVSTVKVLGYTYYYDSLGFLVVVGEVQNQGPNIIDSIILTGTVSDSNGLQTDSYTTVWGSNLLPNQKAPFYMEFQPKTLDDQYLSDVATVNINVHKADPTSSYQYPDLTITSQQSYIGTNPGTHATTNNPSDGDLGVYWVTGTIQNIGTETAQNVTVFATFYNKDGAPVAVGYTGSTTMNPYFIPAGQSATFKLGAFDLNQSIVPTDKKIATYSLLIQNLGPIRDTGTAPVPVATATPTPPPLSSRTPAPTNPDGSTPIGSNGSTNLTIPTWGLVAIAAVAIALVAAAFLMLRRRTSQRKRIPNSGSASSEPYKPKKSRRNR